MYLKGKKKGKRKARGRMFQKACVMFLAVNLLWQPVVTCFASEIDSGVGGEEYEVVENLASDVVTAADINERLVVNLEAELNEESTQAGVAQTGETQYVKVVSSYSHANNPEQNAEVYLKIEKLPEGVTIAGFDNDGTKKVVWRDNNSQEQYITLTLIENEEEEGSFYVVFEQPAGATIEFEIQFNSTNGTMANGESVSVSVAEDKITGVEGTGNDVFGDPVTLTWTAENEWNPVEKWVNNAKNNQILVNNDNQLSGELTYTIKAESQNKENYGEIWTDYVKVTDTLTLPEEISFPDGAKVNGDAVVDKEGNEIFYFPDNQTITITNLVLKDKHTVLYEVEVPNTYKNEEGVPTAEQEHLSLEMKLNANALVLADGYKDKTKQEMAEDEIINEVKMIPVPYKGDKGAETEDSVTTTPTPTPEKIIVTKEADKTHVKAGDEITYTLSVKNTGENAIEVKDDEGNYYAVTDNLPQYLTMTEAQIANLPTGVAYDKDTNTVSWIPDTKALEPGETYEISFSVTVKSITDEAMKDLKNGQYITNVAKYKENYSNWVNVIYDKAKITVDKTGKQENEDDEELKNGEKIQYTVTVKNDTNFDAEIEEEIIDTLPDGLEFLAIIDKDGNRITSSGTYVASSNILTAGRKVVFSQDGQELKWNIGMLKAHETITLVYECVLNTDKLLPVDEICNRVTSSDDKAEETTPVDNPIEVEKTVAQDTNKIYSDGTVFDYTVSVRNAGKNPSQEETLKVEDEMPVGMLPYGYQLIQYKENSSSEREVSWEDFRDAKIDVWNYKFKAEIGGRLAQVERRYVGSEIAITLTWEIEMPNAGDTVTIPYQAKISVPEGQTGKKEFTNTVHVGKISKSVTVYGGTTEETPKSADLQKSVWAIKQAKTIGSSNNSYESWSNWYDKEMFPIKDAQVTNYVIYNMTVINTGSDSIHLETLVDELPEKLTYFGISGNCYYFDKSTFKTKTYSEAWSGINCYGGQNLVQGVTITSEAEENKVTFSFGNDGDGYDLGVGKAITFLMLCKIDKNVKEDELITNKAKLFVDESVQYKDYEEINTSGTPYDLIQNNGSSKDEGVKDGKRTISSSVTITPENLPVPGIEKEAVSYIVPGKTEELSLGENSNIQPDSMVHWEVTLYNDGTMDLKNYCVEDSVTKGFHLITEEEADEKGIDAPYVLEIYDYAGELENTFDISEEVWKTIGNGSEENNYTFDFQEEKYAISPGGYAKLKLYTNNTVTNYQVYKNTATILPNEAFDANRTKHGELKKNENGEYIGLSASAEVNALGAYASISWKTVTEKGKEENTASGTQKKNYISVGLDDEGNTNLVTYTDNIKNISGKTFKQFVVIDLMPMKNDTGVINQEDKRGSEFVISYAGGLKAYILDCDGIQSTLSKSNYKIEFSSKKSYTQEDFAGDSTDWHETWQQGDCSFRVKLSDDFELAPDETLVIQYDGKIEAGASPGEKAWNSFGYQYYSSEYTSALKAEPPKVGVMIPKVPVVKKEVVDSNGTVLDYDESKLFTFELYQKEESSETKLCEFTICQGGYTELSNLTDKNGNRITLEDGVEYTIKEQVPEGYHLLGIGEVGTDYTTYEDTYTFTYYAEKDISILVRNESIFRPELPETGGIGTIVYTVVGALLMLAASLLYGYRWKRRNILEGR